MIGLYSLILALMLLGLKWPLGFILGWILLGVVTCAILISCFLSHPHQTFFKRLVIRMTVSGLLILLNRLLHVYGYIPKETYELLDSIWRKLLFRLM